MPERAGRVWRGGRGVAALLGALLVACGGGGPGPLAAPVAPVAPAAPAVPAGLAGYTLVWSDEFDVDGPPDTTKWGYDTGRNRQGWHNNELQYYARDRPENARVAGGRLVITARRESLSSAPDWGGQRYTSARMLTRGLASWTYGHFEVRARLPCGRGTWPAIWMLGTGGAWPDDGEIDIMEQVGSNPTRVFGSVHTRAGSGGNATGNATQVPTTCSQFHDYQMRWTADDIRFYVDGVEYHRYANPRTGRSAWPFDAPQFMILNIAIGGDLGGAVDDGIFPVTLEIEHVRVYQAGR